MSLELYEQFREQTDVDSRKQAGDGLSTYCPMVTNRLLTHLEKVADAGEIDGWMDYVDPKLTYWENKSNLKREAGAEGYDAPFKSDTEAYVSEMLAKQEEYEQRMEAEREEQRAREEMYRNSMR